MTEGGWVGGWVEKGEWGWGWESEYLCVSVHVISRNSIE
jgi:hypothetical protein